MVTVSHCLTATAAPLQGPSAFHEFQIFPTAILSRLQRCGCDHRRCLLLPEIAKAPSVTAFISSLSLSTAATFTPQRSSRTIFLVSAPIRPQEHTFKLHSSCNSAGLFCAFSAISNRRSDHGQGRISTTQAMGKSGSSNPAAAVLLSSLIAWWSGEHS